MGRQIQPTEEQIEAMINKVRNQVSMLESTYSLGCVLC